MIRCNFTVRAGAEFEYFEKNRPLIALLASLGDRAALELLRLAGRWWDTEARENLAIAIAEFRRARNN